MSFFFKRFSPWFAAWLLVSAVAVYFRLAPLRVLASSDASDKAAVLVVNRLKNDVGRQVAASHPGATREERELLIAKTVNELLIREGPQVREAIDRLSLNLDKSDAGHKTYPYLLASDSYYYYGLTENILQTGGLGGPVKGSKYLNTLMLAPHGHWEPLNLHPYVGALICRFLRLFDPEISLMRAVSFTPLVVTVLALIAFLCLCRTLTFSPVVAGVTAVFFILAPIFIRRSTFGWYDNDPYTILFPTMTLAFLLEGFKMMRTPRRAFVFAALSALSLTVYALFWHGWGFLFGVICLCGLIVVGVNHFLLKNKTETGTLGVFFSILPIGGFLGIGLMFGFREFFVLFEEGSQALQNFLTPQLSVWPDLYLSVSELHKAPLSMIMQITGGPFFFSASLAGLICANVRIVRFLLKKAKSREDLHEPVCFLFLTVYFAGAFFLTLGAQRFAMLCPLPMAVGLGFGLKWGDTILNSRFPRIKYCVPLLMAALTAIPMVTVHASVRTLLNPIYNDTWDAAMAKLRQRTPSESIINTWWPPGHFVKAMAHRRVTFDGATINFPQAYWMANVFLSTDEREAAGILRMLNTSGNGAAEYLIGLKFPASKAVTLLKTIVRLDADAARRVLTPVLKDAAKIEALLALTHGNGAPPPSYCLLYNEFVDANLQLPFIGKWNFAAVEKINQSPALMKKVPPHNSPDHIKFLWELAGGPLKYSGILPQISSAQGLVTFREGVQIHVPSKQCRVNSPKFGHGIPYSLFYSDNGKVAEKLLDGATLNYSVLLAGDQSRYSAVLMDRPLARSMMARLYFFNGAGLNIFRPFLNESDLAGRTHILAYRLDWDSLENGKE